MESWLKASLDYVERWIEFQMRYLQRPGCSLALVHRQRPVFELALGYADLDKQTRLTPRHRFRVASHSKSFTAAGVLKLCEQGKLRLDDAVGRHVDGLHPELARATLAQLLSHSAGLVRDGADSGQFQDRRPFISTDELRAALALPPVIDPNTRFKYSNHGYGLVGLVIESVTGEPYRTWMQREIVDAAGLQETCPDAPAPRGAPLAKGHSSPIVLGRRVVIPCDQSTHAIAPAGGFVSTARDLARYYAQLAPNAKTSLLSVASRREMARRQWRNPDSTVEMYYGLGLMQGSIGGWDWIGHAGSLQGFMSRTSVFPAWDISLSVLTNSADGSAGFWHDGIAHILRTFAQHGAPTRKTADWTGRWWNLWGATDLVPLKDKVLVASPYQGNPFMDGAELTVTRRDAGAVTLANGYAAHGEPARLERSANGAVREVWIGGACLVTEARLAREMKARYQRP